MKKFRVEHRDFDKPPITVVLYQPPYEDENVLNKTGWKVKDVKIREVNSPYEEEIRWLYQEKTDKLQKQLT